jgi:CDP-glucose 4,6-dehydratase
MNIIDLKNFYKGKRILITGHTGFKGTWLTQTLLEFGATLSGIALDPDDNSLFSSLEISNYIEDNRVNILDLSKCDKIVSNFKPEIIFHLAAQPLVKLSYNQPLETHNTNYIGTANILSLFSKYDFIRSGIFITTDKVYKNDEKGLPFKESDSLGGYDPYSASKAASEILIESWRRSFIDTNKKGLASARAGNVIGGGDWAADRIIPDIFRAYFNKTLLLIRNPMSTRPWQHVLDPIFGYLLLGMHLYLKPSEFSEAFNFGPPIESSNITVQELINIIFDEFNLDKSIVKFEKSNFHEAKLLSLDSSKAYYKLGWKPNLDSISSIKLTTKWYINHVKSNIKELTIEQINNFFQNLTIL